jgi:hypothetical protein
MRLKHHVKGSDVVVMAYCNTVVEEIWLNIYKYNHNNLLTIDLSKLLYPATHTTYVCNTQLETQNSKDWVKQ